MDVKMSYFFYPWIPKSFLFLDFARSLIRLDGNARHRGFPILIAPTRRAVHFDVNRKTKARISLEDNVYV